MVIAPLSDIEFYVFCDGTRQKPECSFVFHAAFRYWYAISTPQIVTSAEGFPGKAA